MKKVANAVASHVSNPFSTSRTRPGALPFCYPDGITRAQLLSLFESYGYRGQIVGPHGVGKSTLVADLLADWQAVFAEIQHITIRNGNRFLPDMDTRLLVAGEPKQDEKSLSKLIIIDGLERWSMMNRQLLIRSAYQKGIGLIATVHAPILGLPILCRLKPSFDVFVQVVSDLNPNMMEMSSGELKDVFEQANQNIREALMLLYDRYETMNRSGKNRS